MWEQKVSYCATEDLELLNRRTDNLRPILLKEFTILYKMEVVVKLNDSCRINLQKEDYAS